MSHRLSLSDNLISHTKIFAVFNSDLCIVCVKLNKLSSAFWWSLSYTVSICYGFGFLSGYVDIFNVCIECVFYLEYKNFIVVKEDITTGNEDGIG